MRFSNRFLSGRMLTTAILAALAIIVTTTTLRPANRHASALKPELIQPVSFQQAAADPFEGGVAWLNTGGPIRLRDLKGKVVLLDFWTFCCINCHHVLPDLAKLEEKYKNELVVIGVHTPKFPAERDTENLRRKVREYGIKHPVVNDADQVIWNRMGVNSWPTLGVIDPAGKVAFATAGEGHYAELDRVIGGLVERFKAEGKLNETPVKFFPENEKPDNTSLLFPGKILADAAGDRLFIADTGHNRLVQTDLKGQHPVVIGTGNIGLTDGGYDKAEFHRPQGMSLLNDVLYVADTENHAIRAIDLKARTVKTVAGTGKLAGRDPLSAPAIETPLNSPWDLTHTANSRELYVAMAGPHQIWQFDPDAGKIAPWAGSGIENIIDGPLAKAAFAQPSGLATDGTHLFVADSEVSAIREVGLAADKHRVRSIVGEGLFEFGDVDGQGTTVRLQHCLGVTYGDGTLFVADSYNNKVKVCDPKTRSVKTFAGSGAPGDKDSPAQFYEPGGLSVAGKTLYVADTNNHKIRQVDIPTGKVSTLDLAGLTPPGSASPRKPTFPNARVIKSSPQTVASGKTLTLEIAVPIPAGFKLNAEGSMPLLIETPDKPDAIAFSAKLPANGTRIDPPVKQFSVEVPLTEPATDGQSLELKVSLLTLVCSEGSSLCTIKSYVWNVPITFAKDGGSKVSLGDQ